MSKNTIKVGIAGHIDLQDPAAVKESIEKFLTQLKNTGETIHAYSALAAGSDSIFAAAALQLNIPLFIVLPFDSTAYAKTIARKGADALATFNHLLTQGTVVQLSNQTPLNSEDQNELFEACGNHLADNCDKMVIVWDGEKQNGKGGTEGTYRYAAGKRKDIFHIKAYRSDISALFYELDKKAINAKKRYEILWNCILFFSFIAALLLAVSISFSLHSKLITGLELGFVILAFAGATYVRIAKIKPNRLRLRREAERLRILEKYYRGGINIDVIPVPKHFSEETRKMEQKYATLPQPDTDIFESKENLLVLVNEQIQYHSGIRPEINDQKLKQLENAQFPLFLGFIAGVLLHTAATLFPSAGIPHWPGLLLSLSIPPIYAGIEAYINFKEYHKIYYDSHKMHSFFLLMKKAIDATTVEHQQAHLELTRLGSIVRQKMDDEICEWEELLLKKSTPGP